jgi:long-chain acyl-CoA synthetase
MSLLRPILAQAFKRPRQTAVVDDKRTYSYAKLIAASFFVAREIKQATQAKHVGILLPTSGAFPITFLGTWIAGRVPVPLNYLLSKDELQYVIKDSDIDTVITSTQMLEFLGGSGVIPKGIKIVELEKVNFKGLPPLRWPPNPSDDDLAVLLYTSGTSGKPKGVMLTHGNLQSNALAGTQHAELTRADTFLGVLPQFHSFGLTILTLLPLRIGARVVYTARFVPRKIVSLIEEQKPDVFIAVPSMYGALLSVKSATPDSFKSIRLAVCGAEPLPDVIYEAYRQRFNVELLEGYGLTETSPGCNWSTPSHTKRHSVGLPLPGVGNYIVDENNNLLPPNTDGEIVLTGPNLMKGYYKLDDKTAEVITEVTPPGADKPRRAFRTGDIGKLDEDGFLFITGRKKEMLIVGGENVFPREIEEVINTHPAVAASAVVGKLDGMRGEVPIAFIELIEDAEFDEPAIRNHCRESLAQFKVPKEIHKLDQLPRNPTGKIMRRELKAE